MFQFFTVTDVRVTRYCAIPRGTLTFVALPTSSTLTVLPLHYKRDCKNIQNGLISRKILQKGQCRPQQPTKHRCSHKLEASNGFLDKFSPDVSLFTTQYEDQSTVILPIQDRKMMMIIGHLCDTNRFSRQVSPSVLWSCWLGGRKGIRPVKTWVVKCWRGYLSGARCRLAYGPADATATHCLLL